MLRVMSSPELEHEAVRHMPGQRDCQLHYRRSSLALAAGGLRPAASGYARERGCAIKCDRQTGLDSVYGVAGSIKDSGVLGRRLNAVCPANSEN